MSVHKPNYTFAQNVMNAVFLEEGKEGKPNMGEEHLEPAAKLSEKTYLQSAEV